MPEVAEILIGGDVCPINRNAAAFESGDAAALFNDLLPEFMRADLSVVNLECPLIDVDEAAPKVGPVLRGNTRAVRGLNRAGIGLVTLANNHILDHGPAGLISTVATCTGAGIAVLGAGKDESDAGAMLVREVAGIRVGFVAYAQNELCAARIDRPGASPLDVMRFVRTLRARRGAYDFLVVLLHAGAQHHPFPSPVLQDTCRFMVEEGAGVVICQHSHCPGAIERYRHGHIVYGQGNLLFDRYPRRPDSFYQGFLVRVFVSRDRSASLEAIPYRQSDRFPGARRMKGAQAESFLAELAEKGERVRDPQSVQREWEKLCRARRYDVYSTVSGHGKIARYLNRKMHFSDWFYAGAGALNLHAMISCDSHREMLEEVLAMDVEAQR